MNTEQQANHSQLLHDPQLKPGSFEVTIQYSVSSLLYSSLSVSNTPQKIVPFFQEQKEIAEQQNMMYPSERCYGTLVEQHRVQKTTNTEHHLFQHKGRTTCTYIVRNGSILRFLFLFFISPCMPCRLNNDGVVVVPPESWTKMKMLLTILLKLIQNIINIT